MEMRIKMPKGKVKWFSAKKVTDLLEMKKKTEIFFYMFLRLRTLN